MAYVIALPCVDVKDRACVDECPVDCIYEGDRTLYIHPDECVDCGACEPVCPTEAIYYEDDLPEDFAQYLTINSEFFNEIGSPGGASSLELSAKIILLSLSFHHRRDCCLAAVSCLFVTDFSWSIRHIAYAGVRYCALFVVEWVC